MKCLIREYEDSDAFQVNELALSAFEQYADQYEDWPGFRQKISQMSRLSETADLVVAELDTKLVGAVVYIGPNKPKAAFFQPEWAVIRMLVVSPEARGQGIGRALADFCLHRAEQDQSEVLALHTSEMMAVALEMYKKMGFAFHVEAPNIHGVEYGIYTKSLLVP